jgi:hypothetical protein
MARKSGTSSNSPVIISGWPPSAAWFCSVTVLTS